MVGGRGRIRVVKLASFGMQLQPENTVFLLSYYNRHTMVGMHVNIGVLRGTRLCRNNNLHLGKLGRRPHLIISSSLIESELYSLSTAGAIAFTACTAAPGQLGNLLRQTPPTQPADSLLWTGITVLSALPFCGWMVWPGIGLLRARSGVPFPSHYAAFAALYALPLIRAAIFGLDELALISVFFCVAHAQVERMLAPALLPVATSSIPCDEQQSPEQPSPEPPAAPVEPQVRYYKSQCIVG